MSGRNSSLFSGSCAVLKQGGGLDGNGPGGGWVEGATVEALAIRAFVEMIMESGNRGV